MRVVADFNSGESERLPRNWERVLNALLKFPTVRQVAVEVGMSEASIYRMLQHPGFQARYREARRDAWLSALASLQRSASIAVAALVKIVIDENAPATARVSASRAILEHARAGIEVEDHEQRIEKLEALAEQQQRRAS